MLGYPIDTVCRPYRYKKKKKQTQKAEADENQKEKSYLRSRARFPETSRDGGSRNGLEGLGAPPLLTSLGWGREEFGEASRHTPRDPGKIGRLCQSRTWGHSHA